MFNKLGRSITTSKLNEDVALDVDLEVRMSSILMQLALKSVLGCQSGRLSLITHELCFYIMVIDDSYNYGYF